MLSGNLNSKMAFVEGFFEMKLYVIKPETASNDFTKGGGGVDIGPLGKFGTPLSSFIPEMQRYFDVHHSGYDTFDQVHLREFQLGSAAMASFIYLIDKGDL